MGNRKNCKRNIHNFVCSECGNIIPLLRSFSKKRSQEHIKDLYCIKCKLITKHIEKIDTK